MGLCQANIPEIADYANAIQETLLYDKAAGEESWNGTWAEVQFNVSQSQPFFTAPRDIARIESAVVCNKPVPLNNQFFEYLQFGNGRLATDRCDKPDLLQIYARNNAITFTDLTNTPQYVRAYMTDATDIAKRVLVQGLDSNNNTIYSLDNTVMVSGVFLALEAPFITSTITFNRLTGIQKDVTSGRVEIYQVDPTTGDEVLLLTMEPSETTASYRRYYFSNLPCSCCAPPGATEGTVQVRAIAKMDLVPMSVDTDYCLLQSKEAFIEEARALTLSESDSASAQAQAAVHHLRAIRLLIGENGHFQGVHEPALGFNPFGSAHLDRVNIGMI